MPLINSPMAFLSFAVIDALVAALILVGVLVALGSLGSVFGGMTRALWLAHDLKTGAESNYL